MKTCFRDRDSGVYETFDDRFGDRDWDEDSIPDGYEKAEVLIRDFYATFEAYASATDLESDGNGRYSLEDRISMGKRV